MVTLIPITHLLKYQSTLNPQRCSMRSSNCGFHSTSSNHKNTSQTNRDFMTIKFEFLRCNCKSNLEIPSWQNLVCGSGIQWHLLCRWKRGGNCLARTFLNVCRFAGLSTLLSEFLKDRSSENLVLKTIFLIFNISLGEFIQEKEISSDQELRNV